MQESIQAAMTVVRSRAKMLGIRPDIHEKYDLHIHVPEGATPKDGPSAGITMATALLSLARNEKIPRPMAMTGELTLTGQVLAVGGIREKVIAAKRVGIRELILPSSCEADFERLPDYVKAGLQVHYVKQFKDVVKIVFGP